MMHCACYYHKEDMLIYLVVYRFMASSKILGEETVAGSVAASARGKEGTAEGDEDDEEREEA